ncbi:3-oxoacyl-reductase [Clohesyomyces aquaticus]|uniref:3-oxoacyl-reductase n=1 Tax=Clohesyomyces aquaticus TaxID=1231657 RepID=A0A1Y2A6U0_9PLEO|nr:3-oxoacyl-reductase [Clohesyomyces aquaticus]
MSTPTSLPPKPLALVTGATGGIGRAICRILASHGISLALHYHSSKQEVQDIAMEIAHEFGSDVPGWQWFAVQADLGDYEQVRSMHAEVVSKIGAPTILINNAGTLGGQSRTASITDVSIEDFEKTWRLNCGSAFLLTQLCLPAMESSRWGRVIFISSVAGFTGGVVGPHYASSKSALHGLIHWLASTYAKAGISVNGIAPALIERTGMLPGVAEIPLGRLGTPEEVAETVLWMVKTGFVTNKVIGVDGGLFPQ